MDCKDKPLKIVILSAPSGCGKSTIIGRLMKEHPELRLRFSISATNRPPRAGEENGVNYYFITTERFRELIEEGAFLEHEEVYAGRYYGTLLSELERIRRQGDNVVMDIDVKGALNVKGRMPEQTLAIFIMPPSIETLRQRLESRGTDAQEEIDRRVAKAAIELEDAPRFDCRIVNDNLDRAVAEVARVINGFVNG